MRRLQESQASHEKQIMSSLDFDGHEDPSYTEYVSLQQTKRKLCDGGLQTMTDLEFFDTFGYYPTGKIGFARGTSSSGPAGAGALAELRRLSIAAGPPTYAGADAGWIPETRLIEASANQLAAQVAEAFNAVEAQRVRLMGQLVGLATSSDTAADEMNAIFSHTSAMVRDASRRLTNDLKASLKRISLASKDLVTRSEQRALGMSMSASSMLPNTTMAAAAEVAPHGPDEGAAGAASPTFSGYVEDARAGKKPTKPTKPEPTKPVKASTSVAKSGTVKKDDGLSASKGTKSPEQPSTAGKSKPSTKVTSAQVSAADVVPPPRLTPPPVASNDGYSHGALTPSADHAIVESPIAAACEALVAERMRTVKASALCIAQRLAQCEVLDFGKTSAFELESAVSSTDIVAKLEALAEQVDRAVGGRDSMVSLKVTVAMARVQGAAAALVANVDNAGIRLPRDAVQRLLEPTAAVVDRMPSKLALEDLARTEASVLECATGVRDAVAAFLSKAKAPLGEAIADTVDGARGLATQLMRVLQDLSVAAVTYRPAGPPGGEHDEDEESEDGDEPTALKTSSGVLVIPPSLSQLLDAEMRDIGSIVEAASVASICLPELVPVINDVRVRTVRTIIALDDARKSALDTAEELTKRLRMYEPEEGQDDGMSAFERKAVEERDRLAVELGDTVTCCGVTRPTLTHATSRLSALCQSSTLHAARYAPRTRLAACGCASARRS
jgi:hypothetical protein